MLKFKLLVIYYICSILSIIITKQSRHQYR